MGKDSQHVVTGGPDLHLSLDVGQGGEGELAIKDLLTVKVGNSLAAETAERTVMVDGA